MTATHTLFTPDGRITEHPSEAAALEAAEQELARLRADGWTVRQLRPHAWEAFRPCHAGGPSGARCWSGRSWGRRQVPGSDSG